MTPARASHIRLGGGLPALVLAALALAFLGMVSVALAAPKFPSLTGRVVDDAHMLSARTVQQLDANLAQLEANTGHQLVVATVPDLQGYEIEEYGYQLGRTWGLGQKGKNDGVILLVAPKEHKVRIEVGYGLEPVLTDALTSMILQQKVLPQFKAGQMEQGVIDGAQALVGQLALPEDEAKANVAKAQAQPVRRASRSSGGQFPVILVVLLVFWVLSSILRGGRGRGSGLWWLPLMLLNSGGGRRDGWGDGGGSFGGGGGFSGGGGSFGGGGSSGSW